MMIANRRLCTFGALFLSLTLSSIAASAQTPAVETAADKFFAHFDLAANAFGEVTPNTSGVNYLPQEVVLSPSTTVGALFELRYTRSPHIGVTLNYGFSRYTNNYTFTDVAKTPSGALQYSFGVQAQAAEYSLGYVGHFGEFMGIHPFVGAGGGVMAFRPTPGGGSGVHVGESRGLAYYAVGADIPIFGSENFGARIQFRQQFFGAPDFNQNYLANGTRSSTIEPAFGFFLRF